MIPITGRSQKSKTVESTESSTGERSGVGTGEKHAQRQKGEFQVTTTALCDILMAHDVCVANSTELHNMVSKP